MSPGAKMFLVVAGNHKEFSEFCVEKMNQIRDFDVIRDRDTLRFIGHSTYHEISRTYQIRGCMDAELIFIGTAAARSDYEEFVTLKKKYRLDGVQ